MINNMLRRNVVFVAGWVLAGLAIAFVVSQLSSRDGAPPQAGTLAVPAQTVVPAAAPTTPPVVDPTVVSTRTGDAPGNVAEQTEQPPAISSYSSAVKVSAPAVVSIFTRSRVNPGEVVQTPQGPQRVMRAGLFEGLGSGVIVDTQGHVITNYHVIEGADQAYIQLADERRAPIVVVGTDRATDLAILKIDLPKLPTMALGRSDRLEVGDVVLAIGSPIGLTQTVTQGIVSAKGRAFLGEVAIFEDFIQTDAAINHGNSGGALVNTRGELVGINTAILGEAVGAEGLGLAIPVDLVRGVMRDILAHGRVVRGWLGIAVHLHTDDDAKRDSLPYGAGLVVVGLDKKSPALQPGGLLPGDKIETIDGQPVLTTQDVASRIASHKPGSPVKFAGIRRTGQAFSTEVAVIDDPAFAAPAKPTSAPF